MPLCVEQTQTSPKLDPESQVVHVTTPMAPNVVARSVDVRYKTLVLGGGFAGGQLARLLGDDDVAIVSPESALLYTPLLPEVAAGAIEPRHVFVPLRAMCPAARLIRGHAVGLDTERRTVTVDTELGCLEVGYERLVVALGSTARMLPIPGLAEHAITFKTVADAIHLRNHVLRRLDAADADLSQAERQLSFVFVGAGYAGVEALAETMQLVHDAMKHYPRLASVRQRWVLVNAGPRILAEVHERLGGYAAKVLRERGVEIRDETTVTWAGPHGVDLSDGTSIESETLVWTAGVVPNPIVNYLGLPLDERGRITVDSTLAVAGTPDVYALGDAAAVPNAAMSGQLDPPTCQHALRQARALASTLQGRPTVYGYKSIGEGATLGRDRGIARVFGVRLRGRLAGLVTRLYHLRQVPLASRRWRIFADGMLSMTFKRDIVELGSVEVRRPRDTMPAAQSADRSAAQSAAWGAQEVVPPRTRIPT